jgi:hypothetical protein
MLLISGMGALRKATAKLMLTCVKHQCDIQKIGDVWIQVNWTSNCSWETAPDRNVRPAGEHSPSEEGGLKSWNMARCTLWREQDDLKQRRRKLFRSVVSSLSIHTRSKKWNFRFLSRFKHQALEVWSEYQDLTPCWQVSSRSTLPYYINLIFVT